jgi:ferrous iron transport protein A|uniref:Ferrous iron transport protein A n=1 Tax=candidate division WOR-3 bacterium TaxID=2052148 RepID=A0A7C3YSH2_UNCW3
MKRVDLTQMKEGEEGKVVELRGGYGFLKRLQVLGVKEGKIIKKISHQLFRGPVVIQTGNTQIALGFGMAKKIIVEVKEGD